jgi:Bacterial PH domain
MTSVALQFPLDRGERQLWAGWPRRGLVLRPSDIFLIPFSCMWAGFAVFWELSVLHTRAAGFFALWGVPFVLVGLYITIGRFFVDAWRRARTAYAVTSERIIIMSGGFSPTTKSLAMATLTDVTLSERPDGSGTITFGADPFGGTMYAGARWTGAPRVPSFEMIPDAHQVYDVIRQAQQALRATG